MIPVHHVSTRVVLLLVAMAAGLLGCAHDFTIESRETPVHVWVTAPELAVTGGTLSALIYVGSEKAVEGPITFPQGVPHVRLPTLFLSGGDKAITAVFEGGAMTATDEVEIEGETWVQITVRKRAVEIDSDDEAPR